MSDVTFLDLWLNPMSDPSAGMKFSAHSIDYSPAISLDVSKFAGGNFRAIREPGKQRIVKVDLNFCTPVQANFLKTYQGAMCCFRDPQQYERIFGVYPDPGFSTYPGPVGTIVSFTFVELTYTGVG